MFSTGQHPLNRQPLSRAIRRWPPGRVTRAARAVADRANQTIVLDNMTEIRESIGVNEGIVRTMYDTVAGLNG